MTNHIGNFTKNMEINRLSQAIFANPMLSLPFNLDIHEVTLMYMAFFDAQRLIKVFKKKKFKFKMASKFNHREKFSRHSYFAPRLPRKNTSPLTLFKSAVSNIRNASEKVRPNRSEKHDKNRKPKQERKSQLLKKL